MAIIIRFNDEIILYLNIILVVLGERLRCCRQCPIYLQIEAEERLPYMGFIWSCNWGQIKDIPQTR